MPSDGVSQQPARVLRSGAAEPAAPGSATIVWRSVSPGALPATLIQAGNSRSGSDAVLPLTEQEMQRRLDSAREEGRAQGEALGAQQAGRRLDPSISSLSALISDLTQQRPRLRAETEEDTVKLALAI